jgi:hypothetical protein
LRNTCVAAFENQKARPLRPGFFLFRIFRNYRATRNFDSDVPIELKAVTVWLAVVIR